MYLSERRIHQQNCNFLASSGSLCCKIAQYLAEHRKCNCRQGQLQLHGTHDIASSGTVDDDDNNVDDGKGEVVLLSATRSAGLSKTTLAPGTDSTVHSTSRARMAIGQHVCPLKSLRSCTHTDEARLCHKICSRYQRGRMEQ